MAAVSSSRKISAASARSHTRRKNQSKSFSLPSGIFTKLVVVLFVGFIAWSYRAIQPPPPTICGSPGGPPVTSPRIKLKDGRNLSYKEIGVPKERANYKIIFIHGMGSCKYEAIAISQELVNELGIYLLSFDRPGYGESDPNPSKSIKSTALDIEELADQLELGSKFYVIGLSMGGQSVWGCLKYIPHRLAGAAMIAPVANFWWPGFPADLLKEAYDLQRVQGYWAIRVTHYAPWLTYWWKTQKWFPSLSGVASQNDIFSAKDKELFPKLSLVREPHKAQILQQGEFESLHRDQIVAFGNWEFDPMDLTNPLPNTEGSVHLWHGAEDLLVPVTLSRYISQKLPWVTYHEVPDAGHLFLLADGMGDTIVKALLLGD